MRKRTFQDIFIIVAAVLFITFLIWAPYFFRLPSFWGLKFPETGLQTIVKNYDGLNYVVVAKTLYDPKQITTNFSGELPPTYYAAHFPGYPLFIRLFSPVLGWVHAMLFTTIAFTIMAAIMFYFLVRDFKLTSSPLFLTILFLILPARWLIVHSIGSPEPLFIFAILGAFYFLRKERYFLSGVFGVLAQITKSPGILLFIAFALYLFWPSLKCLIRGNFSVCLKNIPSKAYPLLLMPFSLLGVFYFYGVQYHDFWAYFHSGDNIHLELLPFGVFNLDKNWVKQFWLEDIIYVYFLLGLGVIYLFKQKLFDFAIFVLIFFAVTIEVAHRDVSRYALPAMPFILISFEKLLTSREFKVLIAILFLGIYLYAQNFIINNTAPVADFTPYL